MKESLAAKTLKIMLYVIFAVGVLITTTLPFMIDTYMRVLYDSYALRDGYRIFIIIFLMVVGTLGLFIIFELIAMLRTIAKDPFVKCNVRSLNKIGAVAFTTAALFFLKCLFYTTILTLGFGVCLVICGMFAFTLANLFDRAVEYKEENDLTI